ncbi:transcriptional regulator, GntR family [Faunimonas pinastri]|uniref:Histidine utilization repressor n=1 Tax=Faunimonas pinastri TaxID=1855383 RepID=A0A1H8ZFQ5_9HYPH|nr:histidine utilization repressor [Faunimonas pinastri]SEP62558.1 transcriptional regulator, GntR family [Faunimonas pinastri]
MADILPRYAEIRQALEGRIMSGDWPPGHRIPSELALAEQYDCSRMTVNKALSALAEAGLISRKRRSGSVVAVPKSEETILEIHDIKAEVQASGKAYRYTCLSRSLHPAEAEEARRLGVEPGVAVLAVEVQHLAAGVPFVHEDRLLNLAAVPHARDEHFIESPPGTWLLQEIPWTDAEHAIRAVGVAADVAEQLGLKPGTACLQVERRTWQAGTPITSVRLTYPGDRHELTARFSPAGGLRQGRRD